MDLNQQISYLLTSDEFADNLSMAKQAISVLNLSPTYPIVLVAGTNGKGSTCAYLTTILTIAGYKVGTFTSPHLFEYNERICINNQPIDNDNLSLALQQVINACPGNIGLFKAFTLSAHLHFIQQKIDIAIIEVGIGGLNDATNLFEPTISVITTIAYDHCKILGNTLELIGAQKAGIFRPYKPAFIGMKNPPESVIDYAKKINAPLQILGIDFAYTRHELSFDVHCKDSKYFSLPYPALRGMEQLANASLAISVLNELKSDFPISLSAIKTGLLQTKLPGRLSILPGQPQIILDVAHNAEAVAQMLKNMLKLPFVKHNYAVFGIANDKDIAAVTRLAKDHFSKWFIAPINSKRSINNDALTRIMQDNKIDKSQIISCKTISAAVKHAKSISTNNDRIVCFGSFLVVEEAYKCN
jgi:dihydrofolate synthase/folylpolyglutamate synthase